MVDTSISEQPAVTMCIITLENRGTFSEMLVSTSNNKTTPYQYTMDTFTKLKNEASKFGLLINENKTKYMMCTRKQHRENKLEIDDIIFESVQSFKYLRATVNQNNTIEKEIKERLIAGNKAFYANQKMFQNKLLSKKSKLKLYWTLIRPIIT